VPLEQSTVNSAYGGSKERSSIPWMVTREGERSRSSPRRAAAYIRSPPTFFAEKYGGSCSISPRCASSAWRRPSRVMADGSEEEITSPVASSVEVASPSRIVAV
jgi:hypothetical protein